MNKEQKGQQYIKETPNIIVDQNILSKFAVFKKNEK